MAISEALMAESARGRSRSRPQRRHSPAPSSAVKSRARLAGHGRLSPPRSRDPSIKAESDLLGKRLAAGKAQARSLVLALVIREPSDRRRWPRSPRSPWNGAYIHVSARAFSEALAEETRVRKETQAMLAPDPEDGVGFGLLAGGIAHDFNNLMTVVIGNLDFGRAASCVVSSPGDAAAMGPPCSLRRCRARGAPLR